MSKPFNLADAKAGHPVTIANAIPGAAGLNNTVPAKILTADLNNAWRVVVSYFHGEDERIVKFLADGTNPKGEENINTRAHLVMAPIGNIDGKPVYPGDMITVSGVTFPVTYDTKIDLVDARWPRVYPETQMSPDELQMAADKPLYKLGARTAVANAAICHGIDNGYLLDPRDVQLRAPTPDEIDAARTRAMGGESGVIIPSKQPWRDVVRERAIMQAGVNWAFDVCGTPPHRHAETIGFIDELIAKVK